MTGSWLGNIYFNEEGKKFMFDKLEDTLLRYEEVLNELSEPDVLNDQSRYQKLMKEQADLEPVVTKYKEYPCWGRR